LVFSAGVALVLAVVVFFAFRGKGPEAAIQRVGKSSPIAKLFYFDEIYDFLILRPLNFSAERFGSMFEKSVFSGLLREAASIANALSRGLSRFQGGLINEYAVVLMVSGAIVLLLTLLA